METYWHQIEITDPTALSGPSLSRLIGLLVRELPVKHIVVNRAEGSAPRFADLFSDMMELDPADLVDRASQVTQFDWGDFFLIEGSDALATCGPNSGYREILPRTLAAVRAVDDTYFYVYTPDSKAAAAVRRTYPDAKHSMRVMDALEFPD